MKKVELHQAFFFDCDECGRENFQRAVKPELSSEEIEELREEHGVEPWEIGHFSERPDVVQCSFCKHSFEVEVENASDFG